MKFVLATLLTAVVSAVCLPILPWWFSGIAACLITFLMGLRPGMAALAGLVGVALAWGGMAWWIDTRNASILSTRIGTLFMGMTSTMVILVSVLFGAISGALGGATGGAFRHFRMHRQND